MAGEPASNELRSLLGGGTNFLGLLVVPWGRGRKTKIMREIEREKESRRTAAPFSLRPLFKKGLSKKVGETSQEHSKSRDS